MSAETLPIESRPVGHHGHGLPEPPGVEPSRVVLAVVAAFMLLAIGVGGLSAWYWHEVPNQIMPPPATFPQPRVQANEPAELRRILATQRQRLAAYRWANKQHTLVQIPIDRAMQIIAAKGAHGYDPIAPDPSALSSAEAGPERALTPSAAPQRQPNAPSAAGQAGVPR
jgi:hypothetical protein